MIKKRWMEEREKEPNVYSMRFHVGKNYFDNNDYYNFSSNFHCFSSHHFYTHSQEAVLFICGRNFLFFFFWFCFFLSCSNEGHFWVREKLHFQWKENSQNGFINLFSCCQSCFLDFSLFFCSFLFVSFKKKTLVLVHNF